MCVHDVCACVCVCVCVRVYTDVCVFVLIIHPAQTLTFKLLKHKTVWKNVKSTEKIHLHRA